MEFGITIPRDGITEQAEPLKQLGELARSAEASGWSYLVLGDRLESTLDSLCLFAAIAAASDRIRLATSVLILPPRGVLLTAKQLATIDVLSGGRVIAGVGTGSLYRDYEIVGMNPEEMWPRFEEGVRAMRAYLTPGSPPFKGQFYDTTDVSLVAPAQRPGLPIWIGSWGSERGLRRVARLADGWLSSAGPGHQTPEQYAVDRAHLNGYLVEEGKDAASFPAFASTMALFVSESAEERDRLAGHGYDRRASAVGVSQPAAREGDDPHAHDMVGGRGECLDKVRRWQAAGIDGLFLTPRGPDPIGQMRVFMDDVVSRL
jgi:alkanesulfonate monooxygenase SsuD/methylene tetrahydromethanopterin reductase-like flavin-dependent oxidoreductase (luciferase family)